MEDNGTIESEETAEVSGIPVGYQLYTCGSCGASLGVPPE